jgi:hypothetical protein
MVFRSSRNIYMVSLLWLTVLFLLIVPFLPAKEGETQRQLIYATVLLYGICFMVMWILLDTKYIIKGNFLTYSSGPVRGKIDILKIHTLENVTTWYVSSIIKPALGSRGLTVRYGKFNDIYISPKEKEKFIDAIRAINPGVIVK